MARVTATTTKRKPKKTLEVAIEDSVRKLFKNQIELELENEFKEIADNVTPKIKKETIDMLFLGFSPAVMSIVECAVANELELIASEHTEEEEEEESGEGDPEGEEEEEEED